MSNAGKHLKLYIFRGVLAAVPLWLSYVVIMFLYVSVDRKVVNIVEHFIGFRIPGLGIVIVVVLFYVIGYLASNVLGKKIFDLIEALMNHVPLIKNAYQIGKQFSFALSLPERQVFQRVVLVEPMTKGSYLVGFVTGHLDNTLNDAKFIKVFVPTVPNPTTGFMFILKEDQIINTSWNTEDAMKVIVSGGIIGPEHITAKII
jgi:uncharacterized membrane protein